MTKYSVQIPIAGSITIEVDAANKDAALEAAWDKINNQNTGEDPDDLGEVTWDYLDSIVDDRVCHAPCVRASATKVKA